MKYEFKITGMTCSACSSRVEKVIEKLECTSQVSVNLLTNSMTVVIEPPCTTDLVIDSIVNAGYGASLLDTKNQQPSDTASDLVADHTHSMRNRMFFSIIFLIPLMYISMGGMMGAPLPSFLSGHKGAASYAFIQFLLAIPIIFLNRSYFINGFKSLLHRSPNMDSLIAVGSGAALVYGVFALFRIQYGMGIGDMSLVDQYHMDLYFEASATILALITVGKYLESRSKSKTTDAITALLDLAPKQATILKDGKEETVPVESVILGDKVLVRSGMSIPVDGVIIEGSGSVDQSSITGESIPVYKQQNDTVIASTINKNGYFVFEATRVGEDTTFAQIIELVKQASASKAPIAKMADKIAGIFVPVVMTIAAITFFSWLFLGYGFEMALSSAITVLVISCPCALGLATPVSIMVGTGKGAENKILIKSGEALETLHNVSTVILDKTGTLTLGKPTVTDLHLQNIKENIFLDYVYSIEHLSEHPLSFAIVEYSKEKSATLYNVTDFNSIEGQGVTGTCEDKEIVVGNQLLFHNKKIDISNFSSTLFSLASEGKTPLLVGIDGICVGIIAVSDPLKETSYESIQALKKLNIQVVMLTGDNATTAQTIANSLHIDEVISDVLPGEKEEVVRRFQNNNSIVAMVGDGVNDSPALVRADVGIAIGAGTDIAIESADIVLIQSDLLDVVNAISLSKATITNIKQNLFWAFFYNCIGIPLAAGLLYIPFGMRLTPDFAALAMSLSSIFVVTNALRLRNFKMNTKTENVKERSKLMELKIEGMMCQHCVKHVTDALNGLNGVTNVVVNLEDKNATFTATDDLLPIIRDTIIAAGYQVL